MFDSTDARLGAATDRISDPLTKLTPPTDIAADLEGADPAPEVAPPDAAALPLADERRTSAVDEEVVVPVESVERATVVRPAAPLVDDAVAETVAGADCDTRPAATVAVLGAGERRIADTPAPTPRPERPVNAAGTDDAPPKRETPPLRPRRPGEATDRSNEPPVNCTPPADEPAANIEPVPNDEPPAVTDPIEATDVAR